MFEVYIHQHNHDERTRHPRPADGDGISRLIEVLFKAFIFFIVQPYKKITYRFKEYPQGLIVIITLMALFGISYVLFLDQDIVRFWIYKNLGKHFSLRILEWRVPILVLFFGHLCFFFWRIPWLRCENVTKKKFKKVGLVPAAQRDTDEITLITQYKIDDEQWRMELTSANIHVDEFKKEQKAIEAIFDFYITSLESAPHTQKIIYLDFTYTKCPETISYSQFYTGIALAPYEFGVGMSLAGRRIFTTLGKLVHLLVAGETSSGKSSFLRQMLLCLLQQNHPLRVYFIDLKSGLESQYFEEDPRVTVASQVKDITHVLNQLVQEHEARTTSFKQNKVIDIEEYEKKTHEKIPRILLIIDECSEIFQPTTSDENQISRLKQARLKLSALAKKGRATGHHIIISTQRPSKKALELEAKDQMVSRLCFRVGNSYVSQMALNEAMASKIAKANKGRGAYVDDYNTVMIQTPFIKPEEAQEILSRLKEDVKVSEVTTQGKTNSIDSLADDSCE
ncbi:MAG: hypothetical protein HYS98_01060 [Deltaproteobacteria bacterium]|nr:hypothetical protein [Deltaproteobacteria bacterium]